MYNQIPLNPQLPKNFDSTDNQARSKGQLDAWWDHPYGVTREDGRIDVRCLNGGAWDRSMWLATADNYDQACELAAQKQAEWVRKRSRPVAYMDEGVSLALMPQRPDQGIKILAGPFKTGEELTAWIRANRPDLEEKRGEAGNSASNGG